MRTLITLLLTIGYMGQVAAHGIEPHDTSWTFDSFVITPLVGVAVLHIAGMGRVLQKRRRLNRAPAVSVMLFWLGLATLVVALVSPIHELGEHLFSAHMIEHELVMVLAAPLLVVARPVGLLLWGLPETTRPLVVAAMRKLRTLWTIASLPVVATCVHALAIWVWHLPALFDATLTNLPLHRIQHLSFFLSALFFWWAIIWRCKRGMAAWHLFVTMMHTSILGALMVLAPAVIYLDQTSRATEWGLTPLEDQQLAGLIMWVPGGVAYAAAALYFLVTWISYSSKRGEFASHFTSP
jgi:cytochrome c oxidase assembly factor CtaG